MSLLYFIQDYWSATMTKPTLDTKQDWKLESGDEKNGWTTLEFYRKADTEDTNSQDIKIEVVPSKNITLVIHTQMKQTSSNYDSHKQTKNI